MGYFVQIADDAGAPLFQAAKNYPDVSFASSALFHALVTASLEQGFVPSVLRAQDATIALAVHGEAGSRLSIALVTSELSSGQTRDLEVQLQWRLNLVYRGALLAAGPELLRRQPVEAPLRATEALRKLFAQRLAPMVARLMAEEALPGVCRRVPRIGLSTCGAGTEWLPVGQASAAAVEAAFQRLVASLPAGSGMVLAGLSTRSTMAVLAWQGRAIAATPAWRELDSVDRALLLALADEVGPASFEQPTRSWLLEEVDRLFLPAAVAAAASPSPAASPGGAPSLSPSPGGTAAEHALAPVGVRRPSATPRPRPPAGALAGGPLRMASIRLYPALKAADLPEALSPPLAAASPSASSSRAAAADLAGPLLGPPPSAEEAACLWDEEASLVFSVLQPDSEQGAVTAADLQQSADLCGASLRDLWRGLRPAGSSSAGEWGGSPQLQHVLAAALIDERTQDVVVAPCALHTSAALPWQCPARHRKVDARRRLLHWMHTLPPLGPLRTQHYVCSETYAVAALRRDDGVQCWAVLDLGESGAAPATSPPRGGPSPALQPVAELLKGVLAPADMRTAFRDA